MASRSKPRPPPLPRAWPRFVKTGLFHAISLATTAMTCARGHAAGSQNTTERLQTELDQASKAGLIQTSEPVNRFPDFVRNLVRQLRVLVPSMGKVRIAQVLARAGLHLGVTTVGRILRERDEPPPEEIDEGAETHDAPIVTAKRPIRSGTST